MSLLTRSILRSSTPLRLSTPSTRAFHVTTLRAALSESDHSLDDGARKKAIDEHKDDQLNKQKEGKGHWKRELSSNSEAALKADQHEPEDHDEHIEELQKQTSKASEDDHEHAKK